MIRPTKHSHPDRTIISVSAVLLTYLREKRIGKYDDLRSHAKKVLGHVQNIDTLFLPSINFLYILGQIEYRPKTDSFEFVEKYVEKNVESEKTKEGLFDETF